VSAAAAPFRIVLNYRRDDSGGHAGRLYDALSARFGEDHVFMDIDAIEPGADFVQTIEAAVDSCDAFLSLIGRDWLAAADEQGRRRLEDPGDYVRLEIEAALRRDVRLIPVLLQETEMPEPGVLPGSLAPLARRNAIELRDSSWRLDVQRLVEVLERVKAEKEKELGLAPRRSHRTRTAPWSSALAGRGKLLAAGGAVLLLAIVLAVVLLRDSGEEADAGGGAVTEERFDGLIAFARDDRLHLLDGVTGELGELPGSSDGDGDPDWLRDGDSLAFVRDGDIAIQPSGEPEPILVTTDGTSVEDGQPSWSPDGSQIVFHRGSGEQSEIVVAAARAEATPTSLSDITGRTGVAPAWSPAGNRIAFQSAGRIWLMWPDGSGLHPATEPGELFPAFSPTGDRLAFVETRAGDCTITMRDMASGERIPVTNGEPAGPCREPTFSPDGTQIAVSQPREGGGLWIVNVDGSGEPRRVLDEPGIRGAAWGLLPGE
jgi:dipeptidyl aminopeptidase/acylaminoacyl peptidase